MTDSLFTPVGVIAFPRLFTPKAVTEGAPERYSMTLILDPKAQQTPEWHGIKKAVARAIDAKWGVGKSKDASFLKSLRMPWRSCAEKDYAGFDVEGGIFIAPWTNTKPTVVNRKVDPILDASDVWPGQTGKATVTVFAYETTGNKGVNLNLDNVQIVRTDGPRLDGRKPANKQFSPIDVDENGAIEDDDETPFLCFA